MLLPPIMSFSLAPQDSIERTKGRLEGRRTPKKKTITRHETFSDGDIDEEDPIRGVLEPLEHQLQILPTRLTEINYLAHKVVRKDDENRRLLELLSHLPDFGAALDTLPPRAQIDAVGMLNAEVVKCGCDLNTCDDDEDDVVAYSSSMGIGMAVKIESTKSGAWETMGQSQAVACLVLGGSAAVYLRTPQGQHFQEMILPGCELSDALLSSSRIPAHLVEAVREFEDEDCLNLESMAAGDGASVLTLSQSILSKAHQVESARAKRRVKALRALQCNEPGNRSRLEVECIRRYLAAHVEPFQELEPNFIDELCQKAPITIMQPGSFLCRAGEMSDGMRVILSGRASVCNPWDHPGVPGVVGPVRRGDDKAFEVSSEPADAETASDGVSVQEDRSSSKMSVAEVCRWASRPMSPFACVVEDDVVCEWELCLEDNTPNLANVVAVSDCAVLLVAKAWYLRYARRHRVARVLREAAVFTLHSLADYRLAAEAAQEAYEQARVEARRVAEWKIKERHEIVAATMAHESGLNKRMKNKTELVQIGRAQSEVEEDFEFLGSPAEEDEIDGAMRSVQAPPVGKTCEASFGIIDEMLAVERYALLPLMRLFPKMLRMQLCRCTKLWRASLGEIILHEGHTGTSSFAVLRGRVGLFRKPRRGVKLGERVALSARSFQLQLTLAIRKLFCSDSTPAEQEAPVGIAKQTSSTTPDEGMLINAIVESTLRRMRGVAVPRLGTATPRRAVREFVHAQELESSYCGDLQEITSERHVDYSAIGELCGIVEAGQAIPAGETSTMMHTLVALDAPTDLLILDSNTVDEALAAMSADVLDGKRATRILKRKNTDTWSIYDYYVLERLIRDHQAFRHLESRVRAELCRSMELLEIPDGGIVFQQGSKATGFLVILTGKADVYVHPEGGKASKESDGDRVLRIGAGGTFGEQILLGKTRTHEQTLKACSFLQLLHLPEQVYYEKTLELSSDQALRRKAREHSTVRLASHEDALDGVIRAVPVIQQHSPGEVLQFVRRVETVRVPEGEDVFGDHVVGRKHWPICIILYGCVGCYHRQGKLEVAVPQDDDDISPQSSKKGSSKVEADLAVARTRFYELRKESHQLHNRMTSSPLESSLEERLRLYAVQKQERELKDHIDKLEAEASEKRKNAVHWNKARNAVKVSHLTSGSRNADGDGTDDVTGNEKELTGSDHVSSDGEDSDGKEPRKIDPDSFPEVLKQCIQEHREGESFGGWLTDFESTYRTHSSTELLVLTKEAYDESLKGDEADVRADRANFLRSYLPACVSDSLIARLVVHFRCEERPKGSILVREGQESHSIWVIEQGTCRCTVSSAQESLHASTEHSATNCLDSSGGALSFVAPAVRHDGEHKQRIDNARRHAKHVATKACRDSPRNSPTNIMEESRGGKKNNASPDAELSERARRKAAQHPDSGATYDSNARVAVDRVGGVAKMLRNIHCHERGNVQKVLGIFGRGHFIGLLSMLDRTPEMMTITTNSPEAKLLVLKPNKKNEKMVEQLLESFKDRVQKQIDWHFKRCEQIAAVPAQISTRMERVRYEVQKTQVPRVVDSPFLRRQGDVGLENMGWVCAYFGQTVHPESEWLFVTQGREFFTRMQLKNECENPVSDTPLAREDVDVANHRYCAYQNLYHNVKQEEQHLKDSEYCLSPLPSTSASCSSRLTTVSSPRRTCTPAMSIRSPSPLPSVEVSRPNAATPLPSQYAAESAAFSIQPFEGNGPLTTTSKFGPAIGLHYPLHAKPQRSQAGGEKQIKTAFTKSDFVVLLSKSRPTRNTEPEVKQNARYCALEMADPKPPVDWVKRPAATQGFSSEAMRKLHLSKKGPLRHVSIKDKSAPISTEDALRTSRASELSSTQEALEPQDDPHLSPIPLAEEPHRTLRSPADEDQLSRLSVKGHRDSKKSNEQLSPDSQNDSRADSSNGTFITQLPAGTHPSLRKSLTKQKTNPEVVDKVGCGADLDQMSPRRVTPSLQASERESRAQTESSIGDEHLGCADMELSIDSGEDLGKIPRRHTMGFQKGRSSTNVVKQGTAELDLGVGSGEVLRKTSPIQRQALAKQKSGAAPMRKTVGDQPQPENVERHDRRRSDPEFIVGSCEALSKQRQSIKGSTNGMDSGLRTYSEKSAARTSKMKHFKKQKTCPEAIDKRLGSDSQPMTPTTLPSGLQTFCRRISPELEKQESSETLLVMTPRRPKSVSRKFTKGSSTDIDQGLDLGIGSDEALRKVSLSQRQTSIGRKSCTAPVKRTFSNQPQQDTAESQEICRSDADLMVGSAEGSFTQRQTSGKRSILKRVLSSTPHQEDAERHRPDPDLGVGSCEASFVQRQSLIQRNSRPPRLGSCSLTRPKLPSQVDEDIDKTVSVTSVENAVTNMSLAS